MQRSIPFRRRTSLHLLHQRLLPVLRNGLAGTRIEDQAIALILVLSVEIEHLRNGICDRVEGAHYTLPIEPVVLDEPENRGLVRNRMVNEVSPRPRGDNQERLARTVPAAAKRMRISTAIVPR